MYNTFAAIVVFALVGLLAYYMQELAERVRERSQARTDERREKYRAAAYRAKNEQYAIEQSRQELWRSVCKWHSYERS